MAVTTKDKELNVKQAQAQAKKTQRIAGVYLNCESFEETKQFVASFVGTGIINIAP